MKTKGTLSNDDDDDESSFQEKETDQMNWD